MLSKEAMRRFFASDHNNSCKLGVLIRARLNSFLLRVSDEGAEDVEISRCLKHLGVDFIDSRDKYGRQSIY